MAEAQPTAGASNVIEVENLRTEFHLRSSTVRAIDGVSFSVKAGECVGVVGESGCGKSTLGLSIIRLLPKIGHITSGSIRLNGRDLSALNEHEMQRVRGNNIGMIFQDPMTALDPTMNIGKQIAESVRIHRRVSRTGAMDRALEVLKLVGMPRPAERLHYYPHQLSGGLRQRVVIAIALACDPDLLIADEPTTALDVAIQAQILDLLEELRQKLHMAVILITHDLGVIAARTDRVLVMYAGQIVEAATTLDLFARLRHPYTEALLQSIPRIDQRRDEKLIHIPGAPPDLGRELTACRFSPRCRYATDICRSDEPLLASDVDSPSPSVTEGRNDNTAVRTAMSGDAHVVACFHPVGVRGSAPSARPRGEGTSQMAPQGEPADIPVPTTEPAFAAALPGNGMGEVLVSSAETPTAPVLVLDHLIKEYPASSGFFGGRGLTVKAVSDVTFSIVRGQTFGLVGESGCGKTTIAKLVVALERPTSGSVTFDGVDLAKLRGSELRQRRRSFQMMFQDPYASLDPRMRVGSIIGEPLAIQKIGTSSQQRELVQELVAEVGLPYNAVERYPHEFSGGQRQRIGLARALALNPELIVADEPVSALDVSIQAQILNLMRSLQDRHKMTYIVISHALAVVRYLSDDIGVMYLGKLVEVGPADGVYGHTVHPYTRGLIDTIPDPDPTVRRGRRAAIQGELPSGVDPPSGCRFRTRCPFARDVCAEVEPPLRAFGPRHFAACHFPLQKPLPGDPPAYTA